MACVLMVRTEKQAQTHPIRRRIWTVLKTEGLPLLLQAARAGHVPPIHAISRLLLRHLGPEALEPRAMRQFIGIAVSALLHEEGWVVIRTGVRLRGDPLFGAGALFERSHAAPVERENPLLARFIDALTMDELSFAER